VRLEFGKSEAFRLTILDALKRFLGSAPLAEGSAEPRSVAAVSTAAEEPEECYRRAVAHIERGEIDAAKRLLGATLDARPDWADGHFLLGEILRTQGLLEEASDSYVLATCFRPDLQPAYLQLGRIAFDRGRLGEARELLEKALGLNGSDPVAHNVMGSVLVGLERVSEAVEHFRRAVALKPDYADAHGNLGYVLFRDLAQFDEGARHIGIALELAPDHEAALCNWSMVLQQRGAFIEALALCDRLLAANPAIHEVRLNRALIRLTLGRFREGWQDYEARKQARGFEHRVLPWPEWDGAPLTGKTIYLASEQGLGDEIMFASCVPDVMATAGGCVIECAPKLEKLFRRSFAPALIVPRQAGEPVRAALPQNIDVQSLTGSLPRHFRNSVADFPQRPAYLTADPARVVDWRRRLEAIPGRLKVGISWRGGAKLTRDGLRSIALEHWLPILGIKDVAFFSLQYTECDAELAGIKASHGIDVVHWSEAIDDYDETAALVSALDLIISVQTALVHLAGALGRPVWAMVPTVPEWRYQSSGDRMPWYPSARLYRQEAPGGWRATISAVARDLDMLQGNR
jgi:Flp pilus assembly protein TadD